MLILAYIVVCGKCKTLVKTTLQEISKDRLSDSCLIKITDLRAAGHNPFLLDDKGKRIKILKRLPTVGVYSECTPVHRQEENTKNGKRAVYYIKRKRIPKKENVEIRYRDLPTNQFDK